MTTTGENADRGDLETTIRTLGEITRRIRETFGTEEG
jgi:hypothetical protein